MLPLENAVLCRESQVSTLTALFGERHHFSFPSIFIYGHTASGKTYVMETLLKTSELPHVIVNCVECFTSRILLEHILNQLNCHSSSKDECASYIACDSFNDFVHLFKKVIQDQGVDDQTVYITQALKLGYPAFGTYRPVEPGQVTYFSVANAVLWRASDAAKLLICIGRGSCLTRELFKSVLDKAEYLREMEANLLPAFLRLQELVKFFFGVSSLSSLFSFTLETNRNVTVIFLSQIVWEKFRPNTGCFEPFIMYFPDYSIGHLQKILSHDHPPEYSADFYAAYINILLGVFYTVCRDLKELRHLAALNFSKYCEPVVKGEANERDTRKLWRNIEPHLKKAMHTVYLREISSSQWEKLQQDDTEMGQLKGLSAHAHVELPYYSKFILIAAYLASYNPTRTDKRFFLKEYYVSHSTSHVIQVFSEVQNNNMTKLIEVVTHHGKIKKASFMKKHEKTSNHLLGPKPFPLDRLLAILYSIVDSRVAPTANIFSQITSLVTLQLLTLVGHDDQLDGPKYKCTVSLDFVRAIARTVNFDIIKYLYDFL